MTEKELSSHAQPSPGLVSLALLFAAAVAGLVLFIQSHAAGPAPIVAMHDAADATCGTTTRRAVFVPSGGDRVITVPADAGAKTIRVAVCGADAQTLDRISMHADGLSTPIDDVVTSPAWMVRSIALGSDQRLRGTLQLHVHARPLGAPTRLSAARGAYVSLVALQAASPVHPNIILVSIDTLRADRLVTYGYTVPTDPNLDALGRRGVVFTQAISQAPSTPPSHAAMLTGCYPARTGLFVTGDVGSSKPVDGFRLRDDLPNLAVALRNAGYATRAITGGGFVSSRFGFARGFDAFSEETSTLPGEMMRSTSSALAWLDANLDHQYFLFFHTYAVHADENGYSHDYFQQQASLKAFYARHAGPDAAAFNARYDSGIQYVDESLGQILRFLEVRGRLHQTIVVITADHGETMEERREQAGYAFNHGFTLYDELVRVPLIMAGPGVPSGLRLDGQVESVDITPTLLDLAGVPAARCDGVSLRSMFTGGGPPKPAAYSESVAGGPFRSAIRMGGFKYVRVLNWALTSLASMKTPPAEELYDLHADPGERINLAARPAYQQTLDRLRAVFDRAVANAGTLRAISAHAGSPMGQ